MQRDAPAPNAPPMNSSQPHNTDIDPQETTEWIESFDAVVQRGGPERAQFLLKKLIDHGYYHGAVMPFTANTPYINTLAPDQEPPYPGDRQLERRIKSVIRWNAMALVVRANRKFEGIGGHISSYASAATLYEVGFNHYFRGRKAPGGGDQIYFQGHAAPGIYARAFLEGRITIQQMRNFRQELQQGGGLSSYPHPWLMPDFWEFPTVSMGLAPISAIYQARFNRYLHDRGICDTSACKVWAFLGDGETDEPETLGAITLASRENLDNLIFVVNCNLQRLDGPVRGNGHIIQELEAAYRGAGWNVIKVVWGSNWDPLLDADDTGLLIQRMGEAVDGEYQNYIVEDGAYVRKHFFGACPELLRLVEQYSDQQLYDLRRGGHDPIKVNAAYHQALQHQGDPTVILVKTVKGYGLGEAGEGRNITHQQKKLNEDELRRFRDRFDIPITDDQLAEAPFYKPDENSDIAQYIQDRRRVLGGFVPSRSVSIEPLKAPPDSTFEEFLRGSGDRAASTTMAFVRLLARLMGDPDIGKLIVPIVPDEARTFGLDALFRKHGIYAHAGQLYEPVDSHLLLYYREAKDGQILEEGITEAGSMASFTAAGSAYATHGVNMIPFFMFYSMFGFQRIGDSIWAAADMRSKGFLLGCTAGRTTLAGEGLQHQDGHSLLLASTVPNCLSYDPAFAYEVAIIVQAGIKRMYEQQEDVFYYLTLENETYVQPPQPAGCEENVLKGLYKYRSADGLDVAQGAAGFSPRGPANARDASAGEGTPRVHLFGSGAILNEALQAQNVLARKFGIIADVWSATSYTQLARHAAAAERFNAKHPGPEQRTPHLLDMVGGDDYPIIAASDYVRSVPDQIAPWLAGRLTSLGTDGFGRSDTRDALRAFFEVDAAAISFAAITALVQHGQLSESAMPEAMQVLHRDPEKARVP